MAGTTPDGNFMIFWIISVICWLLLIITEIIGFHYLDDKYIIWTFYRIPVEGGWAQTEQGIYPLQMTESFIFIVFIILLCFTVVAFVFYIIKTKFKADNIIIDGMNGEITKFHFIPLLCASIIFIIGESVGNGDHHKSMNVWGLIFVILGLGSLIFIYIKTNLPCDWLPASIKKGIYSCLIALEWYYFCYDICNIKINNTGGSGENIRDELKGYSGFFNVFLGIGGLVFSIYFKDVIVALMYFLIHLGFTIFFFSNKNGERYNGAFEGVIDIFMMIFFLIEMCFIIIKYRLECLQ